jgi:hypothetical protein
MSRCADGLGWEKGFPAAQCSQVNPASEPSGWLGPAHSQWLRSRSRNSQGDGGPRAQIGFVRLASSPWFQ